MEAVFVEGVRVTLGLLADMEDCGFGVELVSAEWLAEPPRFCVRPFNYDETIHTLLIIT